MQRRLRFSPSAKARNVWIPKQYLTYKNDLAAKMKVSRTREKGKNGRYLYHPFEDSNKRQRTRISPKGMLFLQKRDMFLQGEEA